MDFRNFLKNNIVILDGGTGSLLIKRGLKLGEYPEKLNVTNADIITNVHKEYYDAGSNVVCTNTFGANSLKFSLEELEQIIKSAIENVKKAQKLSKGKQKKFVALDIGPTGKMLKPFGDLDFEDAINVFKTTVKIAIKYGVDLVLIETMNDIYETKAAVLAVKEVSDLPILVSNVYSKDGLTLSGTTPESAVTTLEGLSVDGIGINCSLGPKDLIPVIDKYIKISSLPVLFKPNAGLPRVQGEETFYDVNEEDFAQEVFNCVKNGVRIVGGCCGTTPKYIFELNKKLKNFKPLKIIDKNTTAISSFSKAVFFDKPVIVGERINPTGKKRLKQAILDNDLGFVLDEAISQQKAGAHVLDVNVGIPEKDERESLVSFVKEIQSVVDLPLQIDTASSEALDKALRIYNGKALINSVNGKEESMNNVFPLAKKYGGLIVCLCLDENGIPETVEGRINIAKKIINKAKEYGIKENDLIFDALTMTVSNNAENGKITLETVEKLTMMGYKTILGVSNVSFGLPNRDLINSAFLISALNKGLTCAIMNPLSQEMMKAFYSYSACFGLDNNFEKFISFSTGVEVIKSESIKDISLKDCIKYGNKEKAQSITTELLKTQSAINIINNEIIPALNEIGNDFENKKIFLPQLLISSETAKVSFDVIKTASNSTEKNGTKIVLATVKGDVHDIGKNIVKMLLENYGYCVLDLGKDVDPNFIVNEVIKNDVKICGLSALMTTTVKNMKITIELLKDKVPLCKTIVGGAVLTEEYAKSIGADFYAKDAMETVRIVQTLEKNY